MTHSDRQLRVLQVIPSLGFGGLERVATLLTLELAGRVGRIVVCSAGKPHQHHRILLEQAGVEVVPIPRPWPRPKPLLTSALALARVIRRERPHVIHAHNPAAGFAAALARLLSGRRRTAIVTTYHGVTADRLGRASRTLAFSSDLTVGVGPTSTALLRRAGLPEKRSATVLNGVEVGIPGPAGPIRAELGAAGRPLVVTVGRYVPEKNHALLVEAAAALVAAGLHPRVVLVGGGELAPELERQIAALGLEEVCLLVAERPDARDLIAAADVFALSSVSEGLPLVVLEAMLLGTPVVATDAGGVGDAVRDGETGLLVPSRNASALAAALRRLLGDEALRTRLATKAHMFATAQCTPAAMGDGYLDVYEEAIRRRNGASPS